MNAEMRNAIVAEWKILMDVLFAVEDAESESVEAVNPVFYSCALPLKERQAEAG